MGSEYDIFKCNTVIWEFMGRDMKDVPVRCKYDYSWDWLIPVHRKITEIGLWMMTNGYDRLWLEKSKEIDTLMLTADYPEPVALRISWLIEWYKKITA